MKNYYSRWTKIQIEISIAKVQLTVNCNETEIIDNTFFTNWLSLSRLMLFTENGNNPFSVLILFTYFTDFTLLIQGYLALIQFIPLIKYQNTFDTSSCSLIKCLVREFNWIMTPLKIDSGILSEYGIQLHRPKLQFQYIQCENRNVLSVSVDYNETLARINTIAINKQFSTGTQKILFFIFI